MGAALPETQGVSQKLLALELDAELPLLLLQHGDLDLEHGDGLYLLLQLADLAQGQRHLLAHVLEVGRGGGDGRGQAGARRGVLTPALGVG